MVLQAAMRSASPPSQKHAIALLAVAGVGVALLGPKAMIGSRLVHAAGVPWFAIVGVLFLDAAGLGLALGASVAALRGHWLTPWLGIAGGFLGVLASGLILLVSFPWAPTDTVRDLLLLHLWAPVLVVVAVGPQLPSV